MKKRKEKVLSIFLILMFIVQMLEVPSNYKAFAKENTNTFSSKFEAFKYGLFSGNTDSDLQLNGWKMNVKGDVHSNRNFISNISELNITGKCEAAKKITTNGYISKVGEKVSNASVISMPDFYSELIEKVKGSAKIYNGDKTFNDDTTTLSSPIIVNGNVTFGNTNLDAKGYILAEKNISFNVNNFNQNSSSKTCYYSDKGNITVQASNSTFNGILYAPNGTITLNGYNITINGRVIAKNIVLNASLVNINTSPDDLSVINDKPVVDAGSDQTIDISDKASLKGTAKDDGLLNDKLDIQWSKVSGPGDVTFDNSNELNTNASFSQTGIYELQLSAFDGQYTSTDTVKITVKNLKPIAALSVKGNLKQNRKIILDASGSWASKDYPLIDSSTEWSIVPVTDGLTKDDIKIDEDNSSTYVKQLIFKKPGEYKVSVKVCNENGAQVKEETIKILPDEKPVADFKVDSKFYRDPSNNDMASISLKDMSSSPDNDVIGKRVWKVRYDSNNDGNFDDESCQIIDSDNNANPVFHTDKVGKYRIDLEVTETFDDTISKFITQDDYQKADTSEKDVQSKTFTVDNVKPSAGLAMGKAKNADIVLTVGNADSSKIDAYGKQIDNLKQVLAQNGINANVTTVSTSTITAKDSFAWNAYDHLNYSDYYLPTIPKHILTDNNDIQMVGYSWAPLKDFLFVTDDNKTQKTFTFDMQRDDTDWHSMEGGGFLFDTSIKDGKLQGFCILVTQGGLVLDQITGVDLDSFRNGSYERVQDAGRCLNTYSIGNSYADQKIKIAVDSNAISLWDNDKLIIDNYKLPENDYGYGFGPITSYASHGCSQQSYFTFKNIVMETTSAKSLSDVLNNQAWREGADRFVINLSDSEVDDLKSQDKIAQVTKTILQKNLHFIGLGTDKNKDEYNAVINGTGGNGIYQGTDDINSTMKVLQGYILNDIQSKDYTIGTYVNKGEEVKYTNPYSDYENDPLYQQKWKYSQDTSAFGNSSGIIDSNNKYVDNPITVFDKTGKYDISLIVRDNPAGDNNSLDEYRKWSDEVNLPNSIIVQTRPVANIKVTLTPDSTDRALCSALVQEDSYDPDHASDLDKGITDKVFKWKKLSDISWTEGKLPEKLAVGEYYLVMLIVKDKEGSYSDPAVELISTAGVVAPNYNPVITSTPITTAAVGTAYSYTVTATDADNDPLTYSFIKAPEGMTIDSKTGVISWIPTKEQKGIQTVIISVDDGKGGIGQQSFRIDAEEKDNPPVITSTAPVTTATEGTSYNYTVTATDADNDALTYSLVTAPEGMTIDSKTGVISWIPTKVQAGAQKVVVNVDDGKGGSAQLSFTINVASAQDNVPVITSITPVTSATEGEAYSYTVTASDADNDALTYSLISSPDGMTIDSKTGVISWMPTKAQTGAQKVEVKVDNGKGGSAELSYTINVAVQAQDNPIKITSTEPTTTATEGTAYSYTVTATDANGDGLIYKLTKAPDGMTIDSKTGVISWTPTNAQVGTQNVEVNVEDGKGASAELSYTINVATQTQDNPIKITSTAPVTTAAEGSAYKYTVTATDANGDGLIYKLTKAPDGMTIDKSGVITWIPTKAQAGDNAVEVEISDAHGNTVKQSFTISVSSKPNGPDYTKPQVSVEITSNTGNTNVGSVLTISVKATDNVGVVSRTLSINGKEVTLDSNGNGTFTADTPGVFKIEAQAFDAAGNEGYYSTEVSVEKPGDTVKPTASMDSKFADSIITTPTDIVGTADDDNFVRYVLEYSVKGKDQYIEFASGNKPVDNGVLGRLDTTVMKNGYYDIRLTVQDASGNVSTYVESCQVTGDYKVGNFSISLNDLTVPVSGVPVSVTRSYDTRNKQSGDFGYGWNLGYDDITISESGELGSGWSQGKSSGGFIPYYSIGETTPHVVTITYGNGKKDEFTMELSPNRNPAEPIIEVSASFKAKDGTQSTLEALGDNDLYLSNTLGDVQLLNGDAEVYSVTEYKLTTKDGTVYIINKNTGIESITDPNGNTIYLNSNGMLDSKGTGVKFTRDDKNRITCITDPMNNKITYSYDSYGDLVSVTDAEGNVTRYTYDSSHNLINIVTPDGKVPARNEYDDNGRIIAHVDPDGNRIEYTHNIGSNQEIIKDKLGNVTVYDYDSNGNILQKTDANGNRTTYTYDSNNNKTSETDALGNKTTYTYDSNHNMLTKTDSLGNTTTYTYNSLGEILTVKDPLGNVTTNTYDSHGNLLTVTDALGRNITNTYDSKGNLISCSDKSGNTVKYQYNSDGKVTQKTDPAGNVTTYTYDSNGNQLTTTEMRKLSDGTIKTETTSYAYDKLNRMVTVTYADGSKMTYEYNSNGKVSAQTDSQNRKTQFEYDIFGNKIRVIYSDGSQDSYTYDLNGKQITWTDCKGNVTTYAYDKTGNLIKVTYSDGTSESYGYDAAGRKTSFTDAAGRTTNYEYDADNRLVKTTYADNTNTQTAYDADGHVLKTTDENGHTTTYTYDSGNECTSVTDALGNTTTYGYDSNGDKTEITDANGNKIQLQYDGNKNVIKTTYADGTFETATFDNDGRKLTSTDKAGKTTTYDYNWAGKLIQVTDAAGNVTKYTYDSEQNMLTQTDGNGNTTTFEYDDFGRLIKRTLPLGESESKTYDALGNLLTYTDFNGNTTKYEYDSHGRIIAKTFPDGSKVTYKYTPSGNLMSVTDKNGTISYSYDSCDRLLEQTNADGSIISYTYDAAGNKTSVTADAAVTKYEYDALDRLTQVTDNNGGITKYSYDKAGNRISVAYPNGVVTEYSYDALNRLIKVTNKNANGDIISSYTYTLGKAGNRIKVTDNNGRTVDYTYDDIYRLTDEKVTDSVSGNSEISYTYDKTANRLTETKNGSTTKYTYDADDRLLTEGNTTYTYDKNGNLLTKVSGDETDSYKYDYENHMVQARIAKGGSTTNEDYTYDANGVRTSKTVNGTDVTSYITDNNTEYAKVLEEKDNDGKIKAAYTYGDDLISQVRDGKTSYYVYDGEMSVRQLTDETGKVTDTYTYDAFGNLTNKTGSTENDFLYTGQQYDANTGFYNLRARYYNPANGRFTSMDTYAGDGFDPLTLHKYLYCSADPVNYYDPSGHFSLIEEETAMAIQNTLAQAEVEYDNYILNVLMEIMDGKSPDEALKSATYQEIFNLAFPIALNGIARFGAKFLKFDKGIELIGEDVEEAGKIDFYASPDGTIVKAEDYVTDPSRMLDQGESKAVPNPNGKNGGPLHQGKIQETAGKLKGQGYDVSFEKYVKTEGGFKSSRYGDILATDPKTGEQFIIQVGKQTKAGNPISRENKAIQDLTKAGWKVEFVPYN